MKYLLDTNICIYALKNRYPQVLESIESIEPTNIFLSAITMSELEYGAYKSLYPERNRIIFLSFSLSYKILSFNEKDANYFGKIRAQLEKKGTPIGAYDMQIAAQALSRNLILVTNNVKEFQRVKGLQIENWVFP